MNVDVWRGGGVTKDEILGGGLNDRIAFYLSDAKTDDVPYSGGPCERAPTANWGLKNGGSA